MNSLTQIINGGDEVEYYVNLAGVDAKFTNAVEMFNNCILEMNSVRLQISELTAELQKEPSEKVTVLEMMKEHLGQLQIEAADIYSNFIEGFIDGLRQANEEAIKHISDIVKENENIHIISTAINNSVAKIDDCPAYLKEIIYMCADLMSDIEDAFIEQVFEEIRIEIDENISRLNKLEDIFNKSVFEFFIPLS